MANGASIKDSASLSAIALFAAVGGTAAWHYRSQYNEAEKKKKMKEARIAAHQRLLQAKSASANNVSTVGEDPAPIMGTLLSDIKIDEVYLWEVEHLSKIFESEAPEGLVNAMQGTDYNSTPSGGENKPRFLTNFSSRALDTGAHSDNSDDIQNAVGTSYNKLIATNECILADIVRKPGMKSRSKAFIRAGPRKKLHFDPATVNAAIVTCGGLCPGLNNVIREITNSLILTYGIKGKVYGIRGGYKGFYDPTLAPIQLTPDLVEDIHHRGGTILSSSRGGFDLDKIIGFIEKMQIKQLYVIGGDGTHRGAFRIHEGCMENVSMKSMISAVQLHHLTNFCAFFLHSKGINVAVAGIPKTIDNDVDHIDRSFGFQSAVEAAQDVIRCAKVEASCNLPNGIGIVKLMGRSAGFIAAHASLG